MSSSLVPRLLVLLSCLWVVNAASLAKRQDNTCTKTRQSIHLVPLLQIDAADLTPRPLSLVRLLHGCPRDWRGCRPGRSCRLGRSSGSWSEPGCNRLRVSVCSSFTPSVLALAPPFLTAFRLLQLHYCSRSQRRRHQHLRLSRSVSSAGPASSSCGRMLIVASPLLSHLPSGTSGLLNTNTNVALNVNGVSGFSCPSSLSCGVAPPQASLASNPSPQTCLRRSELSILISFSFGPRLTPSAPACAASTVNGVTLSNVSLPLSPSSSACCAHLVFPSSDLGQPGRYRRWHSPGRQCPCLPVRHEALVYLLLDTELTSLTLPPGTTVPSSLSPEFLWAPASRPASTPGRRA